MFGPENNNPYIYHVIARPTVKASLEGFNGTIFTYGQTTSGKTYTMLGTPENPGLLPCTLKDIFNMIEKVSSIAHFKQSGMHSQV